MHMSALRFFYKDVLKRRDLSFDDLVYPNTQENAGGAESRRSSPLALFTGVAANPVHHAIYFDQHVLLPQLCYLTLAHLDVPARFR